MTDTTSTTSHEEASARTADRPAADLVRDLSTQLSTLVRQELELARLELTDKGKHAGKGLGLFGAGGLLAFFGLAAMVGAGVAALDTAVATWLAFVIVGGALLLLAGIAALVGKKETTEALPPAPERTIAEAKDDFRFTKEHAQEARR